MHHHPWAIDFRKIKKLFFFSNFHNLNPVPHTWDIYFQNVHVTSELQYLIKLSQMENMMNLSNVKSCHFTFGRKMNRNWKWENSCFLFMIIWFYCQNSSCGPSASSEKCCPSPENHPGKKTNSNEKHIVRRLLWMHHEFIIADRTHDGKSLNLLGTHKLPHLPVMCPNEKVKNILNWDDTRESEIKGIYFFSKTSYLSSRKNRQMEMWIAWGRVSWSGTCPI